MINSSYSLTTIRNFSIIAHIDHGKTTLTDAFLQITNTVNELNFHERMLDSNPIEQEKGITIKLAPVRMNYFYQGKSYTLNLIDTPGHVDFNYEVSRSLAACEGAIILVDATKGVQAQTLANYQKAFDQHLKIIPVINKIDVQSAEIEQTALEMMETFNLQEEDILYASAKTQEGVEEILKAVINRIPPPQGEIEKPLQGLVVTSLYNTHQGAIAYLRVMNGILEKKPLYLVKGKTEFMPLEIGVFKPERTAADILYPGEVGYIATGLKQSSLLKIGDTITTLKEKNITAALPGFKEPQPMVFMELYPIDNNDFHLLTEAMDKLSLNDSALQYSPTHSQALGNGLKVGFLGIFHAEIIRERLLREFNLDLIATAPSITYKITYKDASVVEIHHPAELPDPSEIASMAEPICEVVIFSPDRYNSEIYKLVTEKRGRLINSKQIGNRNQLEYEIPFSELVTDFHDKLKSLSSGFASMQYKIIGFRKVEAVKINIMVNKETIEALSFIATLDKAEQKGRAIVKRLKEVIPRQLFEIPIQAAIGGKIIARETLKAFRKDVTAKLYGGDVTRRMKLLRKQARGKKKMKQIGKVELNQEAFLAVLKS